MHRPYTIREQQQMSEVQPVKMVHCRNAAGRILVGVEQRSTAHRSAAGKSLHKKVVCIAGACIIAQTERSATRRRNVTQCSAVGQDSILQYSTAHPATIVPDLRITTDLMHY